MTAAAASRIQRRPLTQPTSRQAWRDHPMARVDEQIMAVIDDMGGACDHEIEAATGLSHQTCSGNRRHLVERGLVYASEETRQTPSGRSAIVWRLQDGPVRGPQVPSYEPPNDGQAQGRLFAPSAASAKRAPGSAWNL